MVKMAFGVSEKRNKRAVSIKCFGCGELYDFESYQRHEKTPECNRTGEAWR